MTIVPESVEWPPAIGLSTAKAQRLLAQLGDWRDRAGKQARTKGEEHMDTCKADAQDEASRNETALVRQRYDRAAGAYDVMTWPMEALAMDRYRRRLIAQLQGTRVLEVGVGTGRNLSLYPDTAHVDAIDFSPRMLERARHRPARANIDLALMDVEQLEWPSESFDSVVSTCVYCSVPNPLRGLMEIRRVLRAGGRALFLEHMRPGAAWLAAIFDWLDPLVARRGPHINRRTMETIRAAGLVVDREENLMSDVLKLVIAHPW